MGAIALWYLFSELDRNAKEEDYDKKRGDQVQKLGHVKNKALWCRIIIDDDPYLVDGKPVSKWWRGRCENITFSDTTPVCLHCKVVINNGREIETQHINTQTCCYQSAGDPPELRPNVYMWDLETTK